MEGQVCELSRTRRCTVSDYRGKKYVGLREYYEKDGAWLPGKKARGDFFVAGVPVSFVHSFFFRCFALLESKGFQLRIASEALSIRS